MTRQADGVLLPAARGAGGEDVAAHFRSDIARVRPAGAAGMLEEIHIAGNVAQALYVGQGYRYRVRVDGADVWAHSDTRIDEGAAVTVAVPRSALLIFPRAAAGPRKASAAHAR